MYVIMGNDEEEAIFKHWQLIGKMGVNMKNQKTRPDAIGSDLAKRRTE
jgi:hypothetical protein